ncbi:MAG TPA: transporter substrate-binding domain-containing protein [Nitrospirae bacterium]|nr:membrane-bound lytic murein transglycosylase F precursor [bacterium BMS3Abin06]HDH10763.1 transporter substrate-binding domain-containing protein [Nitrospirota bacterium]HDZ03051.1 transporter substrate-binding domain-containing protein [Nitrospirota bacterium]
MKILTYIIIVSLFLALPAWDNFALPEDIPSPLSSHFKEQYTDDLDGLLERHYIRVLTPFNKTNFYISGKTLYGFEYSLLKDFEKFLNKGTTRRDLKVVIEFIPVSRDQLIPALVNGYGDIAAAGLTITPERLKQVDFTDPYLTGIDELVVVNKNVRTIKNFKDLSGHKIFVRPSSSYYESLLSLNRKFKKMKLRPVRIIKADENLETEDILELVNSGAIKITIADSHIAKIWSRVFKNIHVLKNIKVRESGKIAWMVRKNNPRLKERLNKFVKSHRKGTRLGNIYFNRYYKDTKWIRNPLSLIESRKIQQHIKLFRKYSEQYGIDWMLIMALAYQESGLDNNKKSHAGAVGIMQVRPETAADRKIGIKNIYLLENNIHAGVKYLAFLRDRYFSSEDIRERDRIRFALAAYNAGPARIQKIRKRAGKMGLDPNRWFRNTELAALKYIGQETVRYVSNINKYYLIFRFALDTEKLRNSEKKKLAQRED